MAKARILTSNPEHAGRIQQHLTAFGFDVEIAPPTASPRAPVELEINLEECEVQEALRRAALASPDIEVIVAASVFQKTQAAPARSSDVIPTAPSSPVVQNQAETVPGLDRPVSSAFLVASKEAGVKIPNYLRELGGRTRAGTLSAWRWGLAKTAAWLYSLAQRLGSVSTTTAGPASGKPASSFNRGWIRSVALGAAAMILVLAIGIAIDKHQSPATTPQASGVAPSPAAAISAPTPGLGHLQPASTTKMAPARKRAPGTTSRKLSAARVSRRPPVRRSAQRVLPVERTEVVVRHFQPQHATTVQAKSDGVKRYSDWDK